MGIHHDIESNRKRFRKLITLQVVMIVLQRMQSVEEIIKDIELLYTV